MPFAVKTPAHLYAGSTRPRTPAKALELLAKGSHGGQERYAMQQLEKVEHELQLLAEDAVSAEADSEAKEEKGCTREDDKAKHETTKVSPESDDKKS